MVGASTAHGHFVMAYGERVKLIGNTFHTELVRALFSEMVPPSVAEMVHTVQVDLQSDEPPEMSKQEKALTGREEKEQKNVLKDRLGEKEKDGSFEIGDVSNEYSATSDTKEGKVSDAEQVSVGGAGNGKAEVERRQTETEKGMLQSCGSARCL